MILLIAAYLLLVLVIPLVLSAAIAWRALPNTRFCPHCEGETFALRSRSAGWLAVVLRRELRRRWCPACGWQGMVRGPSAPLRFARRRLAVTRTLDVRTLVVDGAPWHVRIECWRQDGRCFGRLLFVEPAGRVWLDLQRLQGPREADVVDQALSFPDDLLLSRLRELVSD